MTPEGRQTIEQLIAKFKEMRDTSAHEMLKVGRLRMRVNTLDAAQRRGEVGALSVVIAELESFVALLLAAALPKLTATTEDTDARVVDSQHQEPLATAASNRVGPTDAEVCICAAVTIDGRVVFGHRHCDAMRTALDQCAYREGENGRITRGGALVQGFVTSRGRFVEREEGMRLQRAAGIESKAAGGYHGDILFSEDLY